ncbi:MAG: hypothetical protein HYV27_12920 [Candidatus Hydrogenedentes bacterium]|nr:hypothetical protein [Candidatus Hydrogenedentota bacterium]
MEGVRSMANVNRVLALIYAIGLGIGEAAINWGHWQYAPLWIIDYVIVFWLIGGVFAGRHAAFVLFGGWAFALAVMWMALAVVTDPGNASVMEPSPAINGLMALLAFLALAGLALSAGQYRAERTLRQADGVDVPFRSDRGAC